jgi:hypothetical protein
MLFGAALPSPQSRTRYGRDAENIGGIGKIAWSAATESFNCFAVSGAFDATRFI